MGEKMTEYWKRRAIQAEGEVNILKHKLTNSKDTEILDCPKCGERFRIKNFDTTSDTNE